MKKAIIIKFLDAAIKSNDTKETNGYLKAALKLAR